MKRKLLVRPEAMTDINLIVRRAAFKDAQSAREIINFIENTLLRFASGSDSGVPLQFTAPELGEIRCGVVGLATDCRVFYRTASDSIELLRVLSCPDDLVRMLFLRASEKTG